jgi:fatty acid desaturase
LAFFFLRLTANSTKSKTSLKAKLMAMDGPGIVLIIAAVCCLLLALHWGGTALSWGSARVIGLFVGFGLLTIAFGLVQWKADEKATVPLRLLRQRSIFMGACYLFFLEMAIYVVSTRAPTWF